MLIKNILAEYRNKRTHYYDVDMSIVEQESHAYYKRALESGEHIAYSVYDNGKFIGAGGVSFYRVMPTYHNPTGKNKLLLLLLTIWGLTGIKSITFGSWG